MGNRKLMWLAMAVVGLLFCGFVMGVLPGGAGLLPLRHVYAAMYEVYEIVFPMAAVTGIYAAPEAQNTVYLPVRVTADDPEVPPTIVGFFLDGAAESEDSDDTMPFTGFMDNINVGLTAVEPHTITAVGYDDTLTETNSVSVDIDLALLNDVDQNGIPDDGVAPPNTVNDPFLVPAPGGDVDHTVYLGLVASDDTGSSELVFSAVASVVPTAATQEIVMLGSPDAGAFQDVLLSIPEPVGAAGRVMLVARAAPAPSDINLALGALEGLPAEGDGVAYIVAFDAHVIDSGDMQVSAFTAPIEIRVELLPGDTELVGMPVYSADTILDGDYDVLVDDVDNSFEQLEIGQVVENNELVFEVDGFSTYVAVSHAGAPVLRPGALDRTSGVKAGCTQVDITVEGYLDEGTAVVRFGDNDATIIDITPVSSMTPELGNIITCDTPGGDQLGYANVFVVNFEGTDAEVFAMLEDAFEYTQSWPSITDIANDATGEACGSSGQAFTITGEADGSVYGFDQDVEVRFGIAGAPIALGTVTCGTINALVPDVEPGIYIVYVTNPQGGATDSIQFEVVRGARGGSGGPCFIATAAYGTPAADQLGVLRTFRDKYLLTSAAGTHLMRAYYRYSPAVANVVANSSVLRAVTRAVLMPVVALARVALVTPLWAKLALISMAVGAAAFIRRKVTA